ncbi:MAG: BspA family leucine-rich repeat surface protein [Bacteroidota bacterium]
MKAIFCTRMMANFRLILVVLMQLATTMSMAQTTDFVTTWKTDNPGSSASNQVRIFTGLAYDMNFTVKWGDGTTSSGLAHEFTHTYATPGTYTIRISGNFWHIKVGDSGDQLKLLSINQWGNTEWDDFGYAFAGCSNMVITATDGPNIGYGTQCSAMFRDCASMNSNLNHWNVSNAYTMAQMFKGCTSFNKPLNSWDVRYVESTVEMFKGCTAFNQPLNNWQFLVNGNMAGMFDGATSFNSSLFSAGLTACYNATAMFRGATAFNQPIPAWSTNNLWYMDNMFQGASSFNQPLAFIVYNTLSMNNALDGCNMSVANYDLTIQNWKNSTNKNGVAVGAFGLKYCGAKANRDYLINTRGWSFSGDGPNSAAILSSAVGTNAQTRCINTPVTNITYITTNATSGSASGLPPGVNGVLASNVFTISGTPTASGTFNYTITFNGGCGQFTTTGSIIVTPVNTINLSSINGSDAQTRCINTPILNITYNTTGTNSATVAGLPPGVTASWAANMVTISGTPSAAGNFAYTVTLNGGGCGNTTASGTITVVTSNSIILSSPGYTANQYRCINSSLTDIVYNVANASGAVVTGLPAGVSGNFANSVLTISGTPSVAGIFHYAVTLSGACGAPATAAGTIEVVPNNTVVLSSAANTTAQTVCVNTAISNITYSTSGNTGMLFSGLPAGVTGSWANNVATISGTPAVTGTFNYTITLTGGCSNPTATGSINVPAGSATWLGTTNDWGLSGNWSTGALPMACTSITINGGVANMPRISGVSNTCFKLTINPGATVTLAAGAKLLVTGK